MSARKARAGKAHSKTSATTRKPTAMEGRQARKDLALQKWRDEIRAGKSTRGDNPLASPTIDLKALRCLVPEITDASEAFSLLVREKFDGTERDGALKTIARHLDGLVSQLIEISHGFRS